MCPGSPDSGADTRGRPGEFVREHGSADLDASSDLHDSSDLHGSSSPHSDALDREVAGAFHPLTRFGSPTGILQGEARPGDRRWMARAMEQARAACEAGEVPVGAVLVRDGQLLAEAHNRTRSGSDPTAHAEVELIRRAARRLGDWRLEGCTLYVTLEPCAQCAGSIVLSRIPRLVYGAPDPKAGMVGSLGNLVQDRRLNHRVEVTVGVLADASALLLRSFFRERR